MKTILALAAALPLLAHAATFGQLECTIRDVKVTDTLGMLTTSTEGFLRNQQWRMAVNMIEARDRYMTTWTRL